MKHYQTLLAGLTAVLIVGCGGSNRNEPPLPSPNQAPEAASASFTTQTEVALMGELMASDADGDSLAFELVEEPAIGSLMLDEDGTFTYQPNAETTGTDRFTFQVSDGKADSGTATVTITIDALEVQFSEYSREAIGQAPTDAPLAVNGRLFIQDVDSPNAYDDLLTE